MAAGSPALVPSRLTLPGTMLRRGCQRQSRAARAGCCSSKAASGRCLGLVRKGRHGHPGGLQLSGPAGMAEGSWAGRTGEAGVPITLPCWWLSPPSLVCYGKCKEISWDFHPGKPRNSPNPPAPRVFATGSRQRCPGAGESHEESHGPQRAHLGGQEYGGPPWPRWALRWGIARVRSLQPGQLWPFS